MWKDSTRICPWGFVNQTTVAEPELQLEIISYATDSNIVSVSLEINNKTYFLLIRYF